MLIRSWIVGTFAAFVLAPRFAPSPPNPQWTARLDSFGLERFDRNLSPAWARQQGLVFLTPERLIVYQVARSTEQVKLGPRDATGGAGNFVLKIKVIDANDGHLLKSMDAVTNAGTSRVLATKNGGFLVHAGEALALYSPAFERVKIRELKLERDTSFENWQVKVSPSGDKLALMHEQVLTTPERLSDGTIIHDGVSKVDVEILDSSTLETHKAFKLSHSLVFWSPAENFLVSSNPAHSYSDEQVGLLDFDGNWKPIRANVQLRKSPCGYLASAIDRGLTLLNGCGTFSVLSGEGKLIFTSNDGRFIFMSSVSSGSYLALQCDRYHPEAIFILPESHLDTAPDRIQVYDLEKGIRVLSVPVHTHNAYYAISSRGDLALVDGTVLKVVHAGN